MQGYASVLRVLGHRSLVVLLSTVVVFDLGAVEVGMVGQVDGLTLLVRMVDALELFRLDFSGFR